jgi:hypothetical protein
MGCKPGRAAARPVLDTALLSDAMLLTAVVAAVPVPAWRSACVVPTVMLCCAILRRARRLDMLFILRPFCSPQSHSLLFREKRLIRTGHPAAKGSAQDGPLLQFNGKGCKHIPVCEGPKSPLACLANAFEVWTDIIVHQGEKVFLSCTCACRYNSCSPTTRQCMHLR